MDQSRKPIGRILLERRALSSDELNRVLHSESSTGRLASRLADGGSISEIDALKALSEQHGIPGIDLSQVCLRLEELELLPREIAEKHLIVPVLSREGRLFVAIGNPKERKVIDELEFVTGKKVYPYVALESALTELIREAYNRKVRGEDYYIGPRCPPEVMARLGVQPALPDSAPPSRLHDTRTRSSAPPAHDAPGVVVDDSVNRASHSDDVEDDDFGDLSPELSVVGQLPAPAEAPRAAPQGLKTVLVVDDEADIVKLLRRLLESRGYRVLDADRGLAALRMVKEHVPDVIILDAVLPEVHGFEIARRIKGSKRYGHIPIVLVSAVYRGWRYAEDLKASCGVEHYIEKPFRIGDVLGAVESCIDVAGVRPSAAMESTTEQLSAEAEAALRAGVAAYNEGRVDEAVQFLRQGVEIDPLAYRLHFHLGLLYGKLGDVYEAINALERAIGINSRHFPAVKNLAVLYQKAGFKNKAAEMWERSLTLAPDEGTRQSIKEHLINLL